MKQKFCLVMIAVLVATIARPIHANPHYTDWNGFKTDMQDGGWSLVKEDFANPSGTLNGFNVTIMDSVIRDTEVGDITILIEPGHSVKFSFDQEISAFGFDYGMNGMSKDIKMKVFDASGAEVPLLSEVVPASNTFVNSPGFYGIGDKNSPFKFKTIEFVNIGSETETWGINNLYYAEAIPEPATLSLFALSLLMVGRRRKIK